ncbi:bifunctional 4-hydroxy-2-oxoglutarate aldolase/2-dehydro-3-deoxy-phosphogluconate aldolase [Streptomyces sp. NBC_00316]|uniref:bifunctional 4-hydroxy-2-oxoglutarate aldolase/2-dehydro-3-deoxy-phosphogluconate aldolase n=1 Tax=Streptomyces sp. NBC_00316 TaxID=2975710 RepID=UPI002E293230|nr:bifunctional 4-hydroxy-2-oxoglutarate aldolase/2-dehydro-3-deoxy-phosphogluconate aldolase [Streptomyces sp. NBC_00316]
MYRWNVMDRVARRGVVGIVRATDAQAAEKTALQVVDNGLDVVEISLTTPGALDAIARVATARPDAVIGAGTVLDKTSARLAALAGARFLVCPSLHPAVLACGHRYGLAVLPGAASATEIVTALEAGADAVKLFPARAFTPGVLRDLLQALPQAPVVPTGGVDAASASEWIAAGAIAVGVGGALASGGAETVRGLLESVTDARRPSDGVG